MNVKYILNDLFDREILKYSLLPLFISVVFWGVVFYVFSGDIEHLILSYLSHVPFGESIKSLLAKIGTGLVLVVLYYEAVIVSISLISSFFVDKVVLRINEKYYNLPTKEVPLIDGIVVSLKGVFYFLLVLIFTFYFFFIPVVNLFYQAFLFAISSKKPLIFDTVSHFCDYKKFEKKHNLPLWVIVYLTSFVYFIPIVSLFGYTLQLIVVSHYSLKKCKEGEK